MKKKEAVEEYIKNAPLRARKIKCVNDIKKSKSRKIRKKTSFDKKIAKEVLKHIEDHGCSLRQALNMKPSYPTRRTFYRWRKDNNWLDEEYNLVCEARDDEDFDRIIEIAENATDKDLQRSRLLIDTKKWSLGKRQPVKYGTNKLDLNNNNPSSIIIEVAKYDED